MTTTPSSINAASARPGDTGRFIDRARSGRLGGLDGLRAIAVALVVMYHVAPAGLPGGFLGVDIFFVISGFLITTLLLREWQRSGRISLVSFWRRRARRLLPALALALLVCTSFAFLSGNRDLLVDLTAQFIGALVFVSNWVFIVLGSDYFAHDTPELFRNTWSLSIEEQFYVALPLLLLVTLRSRSRLTRSLLFIVLAVTSAVLMSTLSAAGAAPTRVYFGSDTHIFGLFAGVSLAVLMQRRAPAGALRAANPPTGTRSVGVQLGLIVVALCGLGTLAWLSATLIEAGPESFAWGFQLGSAAALVTVWAVTREGSWIGRALDCAPLRWIGERSYGIYLWHWPLILIFTWYVAIPLTVVCAALSYRLIETPIRRLGFRRAFRAVLRPRSLSTGRRVAVFSTLAVLIVTVPLTVTAAAVAPPMTSSEAAVARGEAALAQQRQIAAQEAIAERGLEGAIDALDGVVGPFTGPPVAPIPDAPPEPPNGKRMFAVGDSVMLASLPELQSALPGVRVDAAVSRGLGAGVGIVSDLAAQDQLRQVLIVGLGTNGPIERSDLNELKRIAELRPIVLVNAHADRWWIPEVNETLASFANTRRGVVLADWNAAIAPHEDLLSGDGIHPGAEGGKIYAKTIVDALEELEKPAERVGPPN